MVNPTIRLETESDSAEIREIVKYAFTGLSFTEGDEYELVEKLRTVGALTLSLVAEVDGHTVGHIAFSPATTSNGSQRWYALGPVSVLPQNQSTGIGSALILRGLKEIEALGATGCILTGQPRFYRRFGFELAPLNTPPRESEEFFMLKQFTGTAPQGSIYFHEALYNDA